MAKTVLVIFNSTAGKSKAHTYLPEISTKLEQAKEQSLISEYEIIETEYVGHAAEIAQQSCGKFDIICASGGDGTVNEVVNGMMKSDREEHSSCLTVLPVGRGNDFSFGAGLPKEISESLKFLTTKNPLPLDVGLITGGDYPQGRYFANGIGVGFDTIVGLEAAKMKLFRGAGGYAAAAIKTLIANPRAPRITLTLTDAAGNISRSAAQPALISVMNGRRMGGAFFMAPDGNISDGLLNLCMTEQGPRRSLLRAMLHYAKGTQDRHAGTRMDTAVHLHILAPEGGLVCHADGETICENGNELSIQIFPAALRLIRE
jgi:YegS/Rv2252/BmrU family lipid kinase